MPGARPWGPSSCWRIQHCLDSLCSLCPGAWKGQKVQNIGSGFNFRFPVGPVSSPCTYTSAPTHKRGGLVQSLQHCVGTFFNCLKETGDSLTKVRAQEWDLSEKGSVMWLGAGQHRRCRALACRLEVWVLSELEQGAAAFLEHTPALQCAAHYSAHMRRKPPSRSIQGRSLHSFLLGYGRKQFSVTARTAICREHRVRACQVTEQLSGFALSLTHARAINTPPSLTSTRHIHMFGIL